MKDCMACEVEQKQWRARGDRTSPPIDLCPVHGDPMTSKTSFQATENGIEKAARLARELREVCEANAHDDTTADECRFWLDQRDRADGIAWTLKCAAEKAR